MTEQSRPPAGSRAAASPLSRSRVVRAAIALADAEGLEAVSMRRLAAELGVVPMALYKHVASKGDLVTAMIDAIVSDYPTPAEGSEWTASIRARVLGARAALLEHPWLRTAIEGATERTPAVLGHMDALVGDLVAGGCSYDLAHHAMHALGHRIWGFSPEAFASSGAAATSPAPDPQLLAQLARAFPHIAGVAAEQERRHPAGCDERFEFEFTLDLLLESFARLRDSGWQSS